MNASIASEFPDTLEWLNVALRPRLGAQHGRVCAIAFFNIGSDWSLQRLDELERIRARHPGQLRVFGVHVPRFDYECDPRRLLKLLHRHRMPIPVAHDPGWACWQHYGIRGWPSVALVDAEGRHRETLLGDDGAHALEKAVAALCAEAPVPDDEAEGPGYVVRRNGEPPLPLHFPTGLAVTDEYLYVADTGHDRVLECDHAGRLLRQFGGGDRDFLDGTADAAAFNAPQGLSHQRGILYVADAGNHAVRRIDLRSGEVDTLCGSGAPGVPTEGQVRDPRSQSLDRPRAVAVANARLFIACGGDNRVWRYDLDRDEIRNGAGSGDFELRDGKGEAAAFAQPAALAAVQQMVYVCDAGGSAIRSLQSRSRNVQTLVGHGPWVFGAADGTRVDALLQGPQAIALDPDAPLLWIADTGNDRLRTLRLGGGEVASFALSQPLHGPAGLAVGAGAVWVADTDAHAVLRVDPHSGAARHLPIGE